jgi:DNA-binding CsgD family transcriptional regulator
MLAAKGWGCRNWYIMDVDRTGGEGREALLARLTASQRRCLELVGTGMVSKEIGRALGISPHTVDAHIRAATEKLGARNRFVAAQMVAAASTDANLRSAPSSTLTTQDLSLPASAVPPDERASAGEGDGLDDLRTQVPIGMESHDSGRGNAWLEPSHPIARFFGGDNRLSIGRRVLLIVAIAIGTAMAVSAVVNSLLGLSRLVSPP